jgi:hypothetical protein
MVIRRADLVPRTAGPGFLSAAACTTVRSVDRAASVEIVLRTEAPEGIAVVLPTVAYAKVLEEHAAVRTST